MNILTLSPLPHTWILDLDGTIVKHNGYLSDGYDTFLDGAENFLRNIPNDDMIIVITSRTENYKEITVNFLREHNIRYNSIIFNAPFGERILLNDKKPSGLKMTTCVDVERDAIIRIEVQIDSNL